MSATIIRARNVNEALYKGVGLLRLNDALEVTPRGAPTREWSGPVLTVYTKPWERVLFLAARDANPFFHLFEGLWMLAGRNDVAFLEKFNRRMREFSDNGSTFHGAYGYRWREWFDEDQLDLIVAELKLNPESRRAVLTMWDPDLDLGGTGKDLPCNTQVYFKVRNGALRTTIMCRSNDMLWGAYGANAVHFSMLHEYVAGRLGVAMGPMYQFSDSLHVYTTGPGGALWDKLVKAHDDDWPNDPYERDMQTLAMGCGHDDWERDLVELFNAFDGGLTLHGAFKTPWFRGVVKPMMTAWNERSVETARGIIAPDWRRACVEWLERRAA